MSRNRFAELYLDFMRQRGVATDEVVAAVRGSVDLVPTTYAGRFLDRPAFLDRQERVRLEADLGRLHALLTALPERLCGGDLGAFARAVGATEDQVTAVLRGSGQAPHLLSRADLYHDGAHFRLMELNLGSALGGLDNAMLNRAFLDHPAVAEFVAAHRLSYVDTMAALAGMLAAAGAERTERPLIAAVDWPASFVTLEPQLRASAAALGAFGVEVVPCHLGQLRMAQGRVWLDGRQVDVIYRLFLVEDLLEPGAPALVDPVLRAVERGEVGIFSPMDIDLYGSKAALAMLSDEANRHLFDAAELATLDRLLPWTRTVRDGSVTVDGETVDLMEYATDRRADLVLKPTLDHGGSGVVLGWMVDAGEWAAQLRKAVDGPYVLQHRIRGVPEPFPAADDPVPTLLKWGVFMVSGGYGGALVSGSTDLSGSALNSLTGTTLGCCFHEED